MLVGRRYWHLWLRTAPSHILQQTLRDLDRACRTHGTFGVRWRARQRWQPSFRFPDRHLSVERLGRKRGRARLPKLGWMIFRWSRPLGGTLKSATVSRDGKHWYVSFLVETGTTGPAVSVERGRVGIDRGVAVLAATSDGRFFDRSFITPGEAQRYRRLQQRHARMTATARGTSAELGTHIGQKAGLNRAILDKGWHSFELAVRNRARHTGTAVRTVNPAFSSTTCPACGHVHPDNRESQARFVCTACGHREHADTVGAKNVLARGHTGHRAWRPRRQPVCEAPTSAKPQGISAPTSEVGIPAASAAGRIAKSVMWDVTRVSLHET
ncbi:hypothetical protein CEB94_28095 [Streptomyces hawaiiensis]|uniref:Cas12f1-like TNB domain-containing protein n=2 Tax=Streptomyces hawaiiensis TaxID=67305 RepID=A0A6G5RKB9_9ACTN|nr:hypothetical protein CEB94_28095 [Streptomyces hawaiiensis]